MPDERRRRAGHIINHASITQGDDTTDRISDSAATFLTDNNAVCDTSADTGSVVWTASSLEHIEVLISLRFQDANLAATDFIDFRLVYDDDELLEVYDDPPGDARMTWSAPVAGAGGNLRQPSVMSRFLVKR